MAVRGRPNPARHERFNRPYGSQEPQSQERQTDNYKQDRRRQGTVAGRGRPNCSHCGEMGHWVQTCYELNGYPVGHPKAKFQPGSRVVFSPRAMSGSLHAAMFGFFPDLGILSGENCDEESNKNARIHNQLLLKAVEKLNTDDGNRSTFVVLDLYNAMVSAIDQFRKGAANTEYKNPLQPCCSKNVEFICSAEGVCPNPKSSFFFDLAHPSDNGWNAIFSFLQFRITNHDLVIILQGLPAITTSLISQLSANLKRIHGFGVRKIAVTTLLPLGCLPISTAFSSYENCSESWNAASRFHNQKLQQEIQRMNKESRENIYETLDLYTAFMSKLSPAGNMKPSSFLMPCCVGVASNYSCGNIDKNGEKKYVVCEKPELSIFWDMVHPAQNGWDQVYSSLKSSLHRLY
ncbi:hypothetical protein DKX38_016592 [Salix brachista]|uniref:CCHC-type domain-containing protein n=1 Tax=Salix brachista TaxID=2182728 RepID=A0A5N5L8D8_9ROSI|nr:hypothetical protein DKX38_016592 [Salix brachista]